MHLQVVIAFVLLLWWPELPASAPPVGGLGGGLLVAWGTVAAVAFLAHLVCRGVLRRASGADCLSSRHLSFYHRATLLLRLALLGGLVADLFWTSLPRWLMAQGWLRVLPGLAQLVLLVPYLVGLAAVWWLLYPVEHASREPYAPLDRAKRVRALIFNLRHQVLIVALPLSLIVVVYATTEEYRKWFVERLGSAWAPEVVLGVTAVVLFVMAPVMLRRIWSTSPLPDGPLRRRLLGVCDRIGLRVREILVWHSDGLVVNAAVMGLFPRVRYILLSDMLLDSMSDDEVEAVFGHEAGHVRFHHIQYFLLFAVLSMLICSGVMEALIVFARSQPPADRLSADAIQGIGFASVVPIWGLAFGWISRHFERQADMFGAACVAPTDGDCVEPCSLHGDSSDSSDSGDSGDGAGGAGGGRGVGVGGDGVCAQGAQVFVGALHKVAILNGIPPEERSWRHSSIASRMRFLTALSGDPKMARSFLRRIRGIKICLLGLCLTGLVVAGVYIWQEPHYRASVTQSVIEPLRGLMP